MSSLKMLFCFSVVKKLRDQIDSIFITHPRSHHGLRSRLAADRFGILCMYGLKHSSRPD